MPGGKPTVTLTPLDLSSFLTRKRIPLQQWLSSNGITTETALGGLLVDPTWSISPELASTIRTALIKPIEAVTVIPEPPVVIKPEHVAVVLPIPTVEESLVVVGNEDGESLDEGSVVSPKERKRSR